MVLFKTMKGLFRIERSLKKRRIEVPSSLEGCAIPSTIRVSIVESVSIENASPAVIVGKVCPNANGKVSGVRMRLEMRAAFPPRSFTGQKNAPERAPAVIRPRWFTSPEAVQETGRAGSVNDH